GGRLLQGYRRSDSRPAGSLRDPEIGQRHLRRQSQPRPAPGRAPHHSVKAAPVDVLVFALMPTVLWGAIRLCLPTAVFEMDFDTSHGTFGVIIQPQLTHIFRMVTVLSCAC